jgi:hypothetical protein
LFAVGALRGTAGTAAEAVPALLESACSSGS